MLNEKLLIFLINTLLLHTPLLALTHRQNYRWRNKYTRFAWAGGTESQFLLKENSYVSYTILNQSLILELKFNNLYVLICIMFSSLVKRALLYNFFLQTNIILVTAEVLRFLVRQCVLSFCFHFQYGLMLLLTSHLSG